MNTIWLSGNINFVAPVDLPELPEMSCPIIQKLEALQLTLPPAPKPVGAYVPASRAGSLLFVSGVLPFRDGQMAWMGKVGDVLSVQEGYEAARLAALNMLAIIHQELGAFDRVTHFVRLTGHVASAVGFADQPAVVNGASDLLLELFGEKGKHARLALGAAELPLHAPVELEVIVEIHD